MGEIVSMNSSIDALTSPFSFISNYEDDLKTKGGWGLNKSQLLYFAEQSIMKSMYFCRRASEKQAINNFGDKEGLALSEWI